MQKLFLFSLAILLVLAGCGGKKYQINTIKKLNENTSQFTQINNEIKLEARVLDDQEIKNVFGSQAKNLLKNKKYTMKHEIIHTPLKVVHCLLTNTSEQPISLSEKNISMPLISSLSVESLLKPGRFWDRTKLSSKIGILSVVALLSSVYCFLSFSALGLTFFHPQGIVAASAILGKTVCTVAALGTLAITGVCGGLIITSQNSYENSTREKNCVYNHAVREIEEKYPDNIILYPEEQKDLLFFVSHKDFKKEFEFSVHTLNEKIIFNVDLNKGISKATTSFII